MRATRARPPSATRTASRFRCETAASQEGGVQSSEASVNFFKQGGGAGASVGNPVPAVGRLSTARLRAVDSGLSTVGPPGAGLRPRALAERLIRI